MVHWTDNVRSNKRFTRHLKLCYPVEMFEFKDVKWEWFVTHKYWADRATRYRRPDETIKQAMDRTMKDEWLKATVGNFISKAIHRGDIIRICPGWYMFPLEYEGEPDPSMICCNKWMILTNWGHHAETGRTMSIYACEVCGTEKEVETP